MEECRAGIFSVQKLKASKTFGRILFSRSNFFHDFFLIAIGLSAWHDFFPTAIFDIIGFFPLYWNFWQDLFLTFTVFFHSPFWVAGFVFPKILHYPPRIAMVHPCHPVIHVQCCLHIIYHKSEFPTRFSYYFQCLSV